MRVIPRKFNIVKTMWDIGVKFFYNSERQVLDEKNHLLVVGSH